MVLFLSIAGWGLVVFGVASLFGLLLEKPPLPSFGVREPIRFPSAIQETPVLLAIGFGLVLVAAGAILSAIEQLADRVRQSSVGSLATPGPEFPAESLIAGLPSAPAQTALPAARDQLPAEIGRMVSRLEQAGWSIGPGPGGVWQASRRGHVQVFTTLEEFRDWLAHRAVK